MILYVRLGCHLCADAWALLSEMKIPVQRVDIDRDPILQSQYNLLVPVLYDPARDRELLYPFDKEEINAFILDL